MESGASIERLREDLRALADDAEALLRETSAQAGESIQGIRERAERSLNQARARLSEAEDEAREGARRMASTAEEYVQERPWQALGFATAVGVLLGLLLNRN